MHLDAHLTVHDLSKANHSSDSFSRDKKVDQDKKF